MLGSFARIVYGCLLGALFVAALPAHAAVVSYTDLTSWTAAANGITVIGFEGVASVNSFKDYSTSTGYAINGVGFIGNYGASYSLSIVDAGFGGSPFYFNFGSGASLRGPSYDGAQSNNLPYIHVALPANITAFGVDLMTFSPNSLAYQVKLPGGQTFSVNTAAKPNLTFFGITSDSALAYADFTVLGTSTSGGTTGGMDNFRFGAADPTQTPELASLLLIGTGLIVFRMLRKSRRTTPTKTVPKTALRPTFMPGQCTG